MPDLLKAALNYAKNGWYVFPTNGKVPRVKEGLKQATLDEKQIRAWWAAWPDAGIGINCGMTGILAVDVDMPKERKQPDGSTITTPSGFETLHRLWEEHGEWAPTSLQRTPSGGEHHLFRSQGIGGGTDTLGPGLDVRGHGQYIVASPSQGYRWERDPSHILDIEECEWLVELLRKPANRGVGPAEALPAIVGERRNDALTSYAGSLRRRGAGYDAILGGLISFAENQVDGYQAGASLRNTDDLIGDEELEGIARSVTKYPVGVAVPVGIDADEPPPDAEVPTLGQEPHTYPRSDAGNGEMFASLYRDSIRWDYSRKEWMLLDEGFWRSVTDEGAPTRMAMRVARQRQAESVNEGTAEEKAKAFQWGIKTEMATGIKNMLTIATALPPLSVGGGLWDQDPWVLGVGNGVLDLKTGELREPRWDEYITQRSSVKFDPDAVAPLWDQFINDVFLGNQELIAFTKRFVGYCLTGMTTEQAMFILHGAGANGKSTFIAIISALLGEYALNMPMSALEKVYREVIPADLAMLPGKRLATASEVGADGAFNEQRIKALTGGSDTLTVRFMYKGFFSFRPLAKWVLALNHLPAVMDDSEGFWRRLRLIPFDAEFKGEARDLLMEEKLMAQLPGILNWALEGCLEWQRDGLAPPEIVKAKTTEYRERSDHMADFLSEMVEEGEEGDFIPGKDFLTAYQDWCEENGLTKRERHSHVRFGEVMTARYHKTKPKGLVRYNGVKWKADSYNDSSNSPSFSLETADLPHIGKEKEGDGEDGVWRRFQNLPLEGPFENTSTLTPSTPSSPSPNDESPVNERVSEGMGLEGGGWGYPIPEGESALCEGGNHVGGVTTGPGGQMFCNGCLEELDHDISG